MHSQSAWQRQAIPTVIDEALREIREGVALLCGRLGGDPNAPGVYTVSPQPDGRVRLTVDVTFDPAGLDLMVRALATLPEGA